MNIVVKPWNELTTDEFFGIVVLRTEVFFVEQRIDEPDFDDADRSAGTLHLWVADPRGCAAYLRMLPLEVAEHGASWSFGRMAVRRGRRGEGLAHRLIERALDLRAGETCVIHAQEHAQGLYRRFGFEPVGGRFQEAGLAHVVMVRPGGNPRFDSDGQTASIT